MNFATYYAQMITIQQKGIVRWWIGFILVLLFGGAIVLSGLRIASSVDLIKLLAGAFVSACSLVPYRVIDTKRERILTFSELKAFFEKAEPSDEEREFFLDLSKKIFEEASKRG